MILLFLLGAAIGFPAGIGLAWLWHQLCDLAEFVSDQYVWYIVSESFHNNGMELRR